MATLNDAFLRDFTPLLAELKPLFDEGKGSDAHDKSKNESFVPKFTAFDKVVDELGLVASASTTPHHKTIAVAEAKLHIGEDGKQHDDDDIHLTLDYD